MIASSAFGATGFSPADRPRATVAADGTLAAIADSSRVVVLEIPGAAPFAEIGIDPDATASEIAWVGAPPRLLVLSRFAAHSTVHLIDPYRARTISEIRLEAPMRLFATVGAHALAVGALGSAVLTAGDAHLTPYQFPTRAVPVAAGAAGGQFVVALASSLEEWDPQARMPRRRLRLPRAAVITAVGGSDRVMWMTTQHDPARIEVIPLVNRGQPRIHDLPEPIELATGHPRSDLVVCIGAHSGRIYVVDLDGRTRLRVLAPAGIDRAEAASLIVGRHVGVFAAQAGRPVAIVTLDGRELDAEPPPAATIAAVPGEPEPPRPRSTLTDDDDDELEPVDSAAMFGEDTRREVGSIKLAAIGALPESTPAPPPAAAPPPAPAASTPERRQNLAERLSASRDRRGLLATEPMTEAPPAPEPAAPRAMPATPAAPRATAVAVPPAAPVSVSVSAPALPATWRDDVVDWARAVIGGAPDRPPPAAAAIATIAARCELPATLLPALVLLYGAHLAGERGAAPVEVARVLGRRWDEALGRGELAARGVTDHADSRVRLAGSILNALDELPALTGTLIGAPGPIALLGPCVIVAGEDEPLADVAARYLAQVGGAILASDEGTEPRELLLEARVRGAVPMLRIFNDLEALPDEPALLVVADEALAAQLGVPRLA